MHRVTPKLPVRPNDVRATKSRKLTRIEWLTACRRPFDATKKATMSRSAASGLDRPRRIKGSTASEDAFYCGVTDGGNQTVSDSRIARLSFGA